MDSHRESRQERERNPITGVGVRQQDLQASIPSYTSKVHGAQFKEDAENLSIASSTSESQILVVNPNEPINVESFEEIASENQLQVDNSRTLSAGSDTLSKSNETLTPTLNSKTKGLRRRQRERNPITGVGMDDCDYHSTMSTSKTGGLQRKDHNPMYFEGYETDDKDRRSGVSPPKREIAELSTEKISTASEILLNEKDNTQKDQGKQSTSAEHLMSAYGSQKCVSRQRQRERNPITGAGMEDSDFRVQIPTFKIHGPQRSTGDPLTGTGYEKVDKEYMKRVHQASQSPLKREDDVRINPTR